MARLAVCGVLGALAGIGLDRPQAFAQEPRENETTLLFRESFDDDQLPSRGWYDGTKFRITRDNLRPAATSEAPGNKPGAIEYHWAARSTVPDSSSGLRRLFEPGESVYVRYYLRLSKGWQWTGRAYHPHLSHFLTTENAPYAGPAATHLTVYIEPWNGKLRLAAQDIQNKDQPHGLTQGPLRGGYNGTMFDSQDVLMKDDAWHLIEAEYRLNSLDPGAGRSRADGVVRGWFDGKLVIDRSDVILRSVDFPKMKFNQFLLTPYFGPGLLPQEQTLWIDDLEVHRKRPGGLVPSKPSPTSKAGLPASSQRYESEG